MGVRTRSQAVLSLPKLPVTLLSGFLGAGDMSIILIPHLTLVRHSPSCHGYLPVLRCLGELVDDRIHSEEHLETSTEPLIHEQKYEHAL